MKLPAYDLQREANGRGRSRLTEGWVGVTHYRQKGHLKQTQDEMKGSRIIVCRGREGGGGVLGGGG